MTHTFSHDNLSVAYTVAGAGPALILLHGFAEDSTVWAHLLPALTSRCRVVCVDLPGFGQSPTATGYSIEQMADTLAALAAAEGFDDFVLIGHSMGGYVALACAERHGAPLRGLGLLHSHPYADAPDRREARRKSIAFIDEQGHERYVRQMIPGLFAPAFAAQNRELVERMIDRAASFPAEAYRSGLQAMLQRPDRSAFLRTIGCPVLFVIGRQDALIPPDLNLGQTHLPDTAAIHLLDETGHMGMFEAPDRVQTAILEFLDLCHGYPPTPIKPMP